MVSGVPFFDHNTMIALKDSPSSAQYNVRLLLADHEPNATSIGLAETLLRFPYLVYLDLSYTTPARDQTVLSSLSRLRNLRVLKLRGIGLKDQDTEFLANAIGIRVSYLDLRNNMLTDMAVRSLLEASFIPADSLAEPHQTRGGSAPGPGSQRSFSNAEADFMKSPNLDEKFMHLLAQPASKHAWVEDLQHGGITHLYIANNRITVEGVASLLASSRLHALDVGTVNSADMIHKATHCKGEKYPGAEKLVPIMGNVAGKNLIYLRAHHEVLTAEHCPRDNASAWDLPSELAASEPTRGAELDAPREVHELPGEAAPIYELADTAVTETASNSLVATPMHSAPPSYEDEPLPSIKRGAAFAPEVIETMFDATTSQTWPTETESTLEPISVASPFSETSIFKNSRPFSPNSLLPPRDDPRAQKIQELLTKRTRYQSSPRRVGKENRHSYLHPSHIPHVETLVLTDVPSHIPPGSPVLHRLTRFITACSNEAFLANLQAGSDYSLPPGQARVRAEQQRSRSLFGLRRIILEVTPTEPSTGLTSWKSAGPNIGLTNSSTGDLDSENLWAAAADDFSFFGEEECGIPENDPGRYFPIAALNEKISLSPSNNDTTYSGTEPTQSGHRVATASSRSSPSPITTKHQPQQRLVQNLDLVAELAAFRRARKAEYEQVMRQERGRRSTNETGASGAHSSEAHAAMAQFVEGHWKGEVKVVRNPTPKTRSGTVDINENYFEKGYLYP